MEGNVQTLALGSAYRAVVVRNRGVSVLARLKTDGELAIAVIRGGTIGPDDAVFGLAAPVGHLVLFDSPAETAAVGSTERVRVPAQGPAALAAFDLGRRVGPESPKPGSLIRSAGDVAQAAAGGLAGLQRERVVVLVCDAADQLRATVTVSEGALDRALFPVREILHAVLIHDGRSFAVAHNHPSGDPEPSAADVQTTRAIRDAARVVGLRFLGHVVVVEDGWQEVR